MIGSRIQPWRGERLEGVILRIEGRFYVCGLPSGEQFLLSIEDVRAGHCQVFRPVPAYARELLMRATA